MIKQLLWVLLIALIVSILTACTPTVILPPLPDQTYLETCAQLEPLPEPSTLSTVALVVSKNYAQHKKCKIKLDDWILWYNSQQTLYNSVTK